MNARLINLSALFLVGTVARLADAQGVNLAPATATDPLRAPPPGAATSDSTPPTGVDTAREQEQPEAPPPPVAAPRTPSPAATPAAVGTASPAAGATVAVAPAPAAPVPPPKKPESDDGPLSMGLEPAAPQAAKLPTGATPSFERSKRIDDWRFDFHGYLNLPLAIGFGTRDPNKAFIGQSTLTMHTPPRIPGDLESFDYTGIMPTPYAQLNFAYGNSFVTATVIIAARSVTDASAFFNPPDQMGIHDAFLTFRALDRKNDKISLDVGAFTNRYGIMGEYDLGRYGTPLIAKLGGMGTTATARFTRGDLRYQFEAGIMGQLNKAPVGEEPGSWNGYSDPNTGTSFALHGHGGVDYKRQASLALHAIHTLVQDDRVAPTQTDGHITILAAETRLSVGRFGHFYAGFSHTDAVDARGISNVVRILNAKGGPGLMTEYFGQGTDANGTPNTSGKLDTLGFEYDISLGNLLRAPGRFNGRAPDVSLGAFGILTAVSSPIKEDATYGVPIKRDGVKKFKYGIEGAYSIFSWFALGGRYDRVIQDTSDPTRTHAILTGRLIFRSDWQAQDQVMLQYSRFFSGSGVWVREGSPPTYDPRVVPDSDVVQLVATMWW
jgi:hypothetical protein